MLWHFCLIRPDHLGDGYCRRFCGRAVFSLARRNRLPRISKRDACPHHYGLDIHCLALLCLSYQYNLCYKRKLEIGSEFSKRLAFWARLGIRKRRTNWIARKQKRTRWLSYRRIACRTLRKYRLKLCQGRRRIQLLYLHWAVQGWRWRNWVVMQ